jgi:hypothetical protein
MKHQYGIKNTFAINGVIQETDNFTYGDNDFSFLQTISVAFGRKDIAITKYRLLLEVKIVNIMIDNKEKNCLMLLFNYNNACLNKEVLVYEK